MDEDLCEFIDEMKKRFPEIKTTLLIKIFRKAYLINNYWINVCNRPVTDIETSRVNKHQEVIRLYLKDLPFIVKFGTDPRGATTKLYYNEDNYVGVC